MRLSMVLIVSLAVTLSGGCALTNMHRKAYVPAHDMDIGAMSLRNSGQ